MRARARARRGGAWLGVGLAWLAFYLTVHLNVNDEHYSFWLPMKFIVAAPQVGFSLAAVYGFGRLFAQPLAVPVGRLLLYLAGCFVLLHVVYYYAEWAAQPFAPALSVTHRRWTFFMASQGPFYFLHNFHYLRTVSPHLFFSQLCVPLGVKLLWDARRENQRLAAARRRQLAGELAGVRTRLHPVFLQQTLGHLGQLLMEAQSVLAAAVTLQLAQVLRYSLYEARGAHVPLQPELNALLDYVQLQELCLQGQVDVVLHLTAAPAGPLLVPSNVLLPLTEQWLGRATTALEIDLRVHEDLLTLELRATGPLSPTPVVPAALLARLAHHAPTHHLAIHCPAGGPTLRLRLPLSPPSLSAP